MTLILNLCLFFFLLVGCTAENRQKETLLDCVNCHTMELDAHHQQPCVSCHKGKSPAKDKESGHQNLVRLPAHPENSLEACGSCHNEITLQITDSEHYTLRNSTNLFRNAFGAENELTSFLETPKNNSPETNLELADDLLRRRCYRCHPYNSGDNYPSIAHGTGCAACHLAFSEGKLLSHAFSKPEDEQCLACHYGNYVGFDYYGRFEHDLNVEYRTPYTTKNKYFRPYGVEYHQLKPDIHQLKGMTCIDCHSGRELMQPGSDKITCESCHQLDGLLEAELPQIEKRKSLFILHDKKGKEHIIPLMQHPAHFQYQESIACQVCHAQWTFNDAGKHYLRSDTDDFDSWANLSVQGDFTVETIVDNNNDFDKDELPPLMSDKITGEPESGIWYKGFTLRRWESLILGRNDQGTISTMRPMFDYSLSWIDENENIRFDSVKPQESIKKMLPYVPHTTGSAGIFYNQPIQQFLAAEQTDAAN